MRIVADIIEYTLKNAKIQFYLLASYHMQEAGANQVQELAYDFEGWKGIY